MLIKHKLTASSAILVCALTLMLFLLNYSSQGLQKNISITDHLGSVKGYILQLKANGNNFINKKNNNDVELFEGKISLLNKEIDWLNNEFTDLVGVATPEVTRLKNELKNYNNAFQQVVECNDVLV